MSAIEVRGNATADELVAVMAALNESPSTLDYRYERSRRIRIAAVANRDHLAGSGHSDS